MNRFLPLLFLLLLVISCGQRSSQGFISSLTLETQPKTVMGSTNSCNDKLSYIPDERYPDHTPMKWIKVNFHIMHPEAGGNNFDKRSAKVFMNEVLHCANEKLSRNKQMNLPVGNTNPALPIQYRYKIWPRKYIAGDDGIYHHYDDELYYILSKGKVRNNYSRKVFEKYGIQKDTVMNIFVMGIHVDSLKSKTYKPSSNGIALGTWLKVAKWHYNAQDTIIKDGKIKVPKGRWYAQALLNHEVGHNVGLRHTWRGNDGCDDTPNNANCWNEKSGGKCREEWSNNIMDYNSRAGAWSPCQIGTAHYKMSKKKDKLRGLLIKTWCRYDKEKSIHIYDDVVWPGAKDLEGDIIIENGGSLTIQCRVSLPKGARIAVAEKGRLILDGAHLENDCGQKWKGIETWSKGANKGLVIAQNDPVIEHAENSIQMVNKAIP